MTTKTYLAIDLKSFYASVECVARGLDPLTARLVVADATRTEKTICLAISPALKSLGLSGRARLFEVIKCFGKVKLRQETTYDQTGDEIITHVATSKYNKGDFLIARPRMQLYVDISQKIVSIYNQFVASEDIHIYSIDEVFIDITPYLDTYHMSPHELAKKMIREVYCQTGITATAGIGTNLYLAKIAMDILAKHQPPDEDDVRIAELDEYTYRKTLWGHRSLADFWRIGNGISRRLQHLGIYTMGDLARYSLTGSDNLYSEFGVNAELLIDHAWGYEPVEMLDIKSYRSNNHSISSGQVLARPYDFTETLTIVNEMANALALKLLDKRILTDQLILTLVGEKHALTHGSIRLGDFTNSSDIILQYASKLYHQIASPQDKFRRIYIVATHIIPSYKIKTQPKQLDLFTDYEKTESELARHARRDEAILKIQHRYGKNALLRGFNFEPGATMKKRNQEIGGHRA
ncbi:DNA methylase [Candidatus Saccharibacteria bacterium]|nr:DNA methylase [Candidatus Saccharibacteria bacterium]